MKSEKISSPSRRNTWKTLTAITVMVATLPLAAFADDADDDYIVPDAPKIEAPVKRQELPAPPADTEPWYKLLYKVYTDGQSSDLAEFTTFSFQKGTSFDPTVERTVQYFTLSTKIDFLGNMTPISASTVKEVWTKLPDGWKVRQSLRVADTQGRLRQAYEKELSFSSKNILTGANILPTAAVTDPAMIADWEAEKALWVSEYVDSKP